MSAILKFSRFAAAAAAAVLTGSTALSTAAPVAAQSIPTYATGSSDETVHGTIASVDGRYHISVRDARGFIDNVTLHQGTIINPTGLTLAPGQSVTILGRTGGNALRASEIDTPYSIAYPASGYPGYGYWGFPYRNYNYGYGYGPAYRVGIGFGRGFGFGSRGW